MFLIDGKSLRVQIIIQDKTLKGKEILRVSRIKGIFQPGFSNTDLNFKIFKILMESAMVIKYKIAEKNII